MLKPIMPLPANDAMFARDVLAQTGTIAAAESYAGDLAATCIVAAAAHLRATQERPTVYDLAVNLRSQQFPSLLIEWSRSPHPVARQNARIALALLGADAPRMGNLAADLQQRTARYA